MKRRIVCLLLCLLMAFSACVVLSSCGGGDKECTHVDKNKDGKCDKCKEKMPSNKCSHEDEDGDGKCDKCDKTMEEDVIVYPWADDAPVDLFFMMSHNANALPSGCERYLAGESKYDETIDSMVVERNSDAYYEVNVALTYDYYDNNNSAYSWGKCVTVMYDTIKTNAPGAPDMYCNFQYDLIGVYLKGMFANLRSTNYTGENYFEFLDEDYDEFVDNRGYMYEYMMSTTLNEDKMYILASDYFTDLIRAFFAIPVNIKLMEQVGPTVTGDYDGSGKFTIDDFYAQVKDRDWTYDLMARYSETVYKKGEKNTAAGESLHDILGFAVGYTGLHGTALVYTTKITIIEKSTNPETGKREFSYPSECEDLYDLAVALNDLMDATGVLCVANDSCPETIKEYGAAGDTSIRTRFCQDAVLFGNTICIGALELPEYQRLKNSPGSGFGIVPVPLYHEVDKSINDPEDPAYESYLTTIHNIGRPGAISKFTKNFSACTAFLNYQSTHSTDILNYYYDYQLQYDIADGSKGTVEMLQYIRQNVRSAFDKSFEDALALYDGSSGNRWHAILANAEFECENMRNEYQSRILDKQELLKQLYLEFPALP